MSLELLKESSTWILSGIMAMIWSILANLITPYLKRKYDQHKKTPHKQLAKAQKHIDRAKKVKSEVIALQASQSFRAEQKLDAIHKQLVGIFFYLLSFVFMWLSSIAEPFFILALASVIIFFMGTDHIDKGTKLFSQAILAAKRSQEIKPYKDKSKNEIALKFTEMNKRDFGIE